MRNDTPLDIVATRVSFENSFDSKQPKLEPKLVSALSETKRLFLLFRFNTETECFDVSIEPKQAEDQPKQFDREHILPFFIENLGIFRTFSFFFVFFWLFSEQLVSLFRFYTETESFDDLIELKQTEDPPKRVYFFWGIFQKKSCGIEPLKGYESCVSHSHCRIELWGQ